MATHNESPAAPSDTRFVRTQFGRIAYTDSDPDAELTGAPLVFVHGNSASRAVFRAQLDDDFGPRRLLALDLLGHGESDNATDPEQAYTHRGYAATIVEVLTALGIKRAVVVGWSLGGYIGLELIPRFPGLAGLIMTGTPPVGKDTLGDGFLPTADLRYAGVEDITLAEAADYADQVTTPPAPEGVLSDILRTDGRARRVMFASVWAGHDLDKRALVATSSVPLAIIDGREDPFVNRTYVDSLTYAALWRSTPVVMDGCRHAPFLDNPAQYNELIREFLHDNKL
ncbi:alpha/beta hydrolase (plasmid) [Embleya sp. NBC_00888]|uniref:alpha/beta fold hydrolase n=1 Tax=Embleya sp. NBC_00888 TaxID=2975960 RepID=UPI002F90CBB3|nr:alpha/beta hydrolase [Embleya sp. NBC_00888]